LTNHLIDNAIFQTALSSEKWRFNTYMNIALDFLLKYYIIYQNVLTIGTKCIKNQREYILHPLSGVIKRTPRCLSK